MACSCSKGKKGAVQYVHIGPDGKVTVKATKVEAIAMATRLGGRWEERPK